MTGDFDSPGQTDLELPSCCLYDGVHIVRYSYRPALRTVLWWQGHFIPSPEYNNAVLIYTLFCFIFVII